MFVRESKYRALQAAHTLLEFQYATLLAQWNELVTEINEKGGRTFLNGYPKQFTNDDIRKLLLLCHPDKHCGKQIAQDMTAKLLAMRAA
jgi:hypothetical protein